MNKLQKAQVISASRHYADLVDAADNQIRGNFKTKSQKACVGDWVSYSISDEEVLIEDILPRNNCLLRSYFNKTKELVANLDLLIVIAAPKPLFNCNFIDRILSAAIEQNIPYVIAINKSDLEEQLTETKNEIEIYNTLGIDVIYYSAKTNDSLGQLKTKIENPEHHIIAFTGISGVGKSSTINALIPGTQVKTNEVSRSSGQGKQTTTEAVAHKYNSKTYIVDLPGIQSYGLSHLTIDDLRKAFFEFNTGNYKCRFNNCRHINEPNCSVLKGIEEGTISKSRYQSYLNILEELEANKDY